MISMGVGMRKPRGADSAAAGSAQALDYRE